MVNAMNEKIRNFDWKSPVVSTAIAMIVLMIIFGILNPAFWKMSNILTILLNASVIGIFASGMTMVIISGNIDLSTTSTAAVGVMAFGVLYSKGVPILTGCIVALLVSTVCGCINGILVAKAHLNSLMATTGTQLIYRAVAYIFTDIKTITLTNDKFFAFGRMTVLRVPVSVFYMLGVMAVVGYILSSTAFGRRVYAVGGNIQASYYSGIKIERTQIQIFTIMGLISGFAGIVTAAQSAACAPITLTGREFDFISPCVIGGIAMSGGKGRIIGTLIGCLLLAVVSNGMVLVGLQSYWQSLVKGMILIFAMLVDTLRNKQSLA